MVTFRENKVENKQQKSGRKHTNRDRADDRETEKMGIECTRRSRSRTRGADIRQ
jgi:hypothetical protein